MFYFCKTGFVLIRYFFSEDQERVGFSDYQKKILLELKYLFNNNTLGVN